jgi:hypothetical protein
VETRISWAAVYGIRPSEPRCASIETLEGVARRDSRGGLTRLERSPWASGTGT